MTNEQLVEKIRNGYSVTDHMQTLYQRNLSLIKRIIRPYTIYESMEDILQEAYFGLWEAVQHYETSENVLFMTYAGYWIRQAVMRYIEDCGSVVRIPSHAKQKIRRYQKTVERLSQEYGRMPTDAEIADSMCVNLSVLGNIKKYSQGISSLDVSLCEDAEETLSDTLKADFNLENEVVDKIYAEHSKNELWGIVERYTNSRENYIIKKYFINNKSMPEIAKEENLTVGKIREIKENGLRRLRRGKAKRELFEKFEIAECGMYRNSMNKFNEHVFTSTVEYIAIRRSEIQAEYEKKSQKYLGYKQLKR